MRKSTIEVLDLAVRQDVVKTFARKLESDYAVAETGHAMAKAVCAKLGSGAYEGLSSGHDLARALETDARAVCHDLHLRVGYRPVRKAPTTAPAPELMRKHNSFLSEGQPYLVNTFHHRHDDRVEEFWTTDLGGASYGAQKPLFVLTSKSTISGGEEFAYDVQAFQRGLVVGETTVGAANPTRSAELNHGFVAWIPFGRAVHPITQTSWEGLGVRPDLAVPAEQALARAHRLALEGLMSQVQDRRERAPLEAFALRLELANAAPIGPRFAPTQLTGVYAPAFAGPSFTVEECDGTLVLHLPGAPGAVLVAVAGNRYRLAGFPDGFFVTFLDRDGRLCLLQEQPGSALVFSKQ